MIPQFFYDARIYDYINELVTFGATDFSSILDTERDNITIKIIDVLGADAYNILIGSDDFDKLLNNFKTFLKTANSESAYETLQTMRSNALDHYAVHIEDLMDEIKDSRRNTRRIEAGMKPMIDNQNGEITWRKSA